MAAPAMHVREVYATVKLTDPIPEWTRDAACKDRTDLDWFGSGSDPRIEETRVCGKCPVRAECLAYALRHRLDEHGIWGGLSPSDRRRVRRGRPPQRPADADRRVGEKVRKLDDAGAYDLIAYAARRYGISVVDLVSVPHRTVDAVDSARIEVMGALRDEGWSLARIGALFGITGPTVRKYTLAAADHAPPARHEDPHVDQLIRYAARRHGVDPADLTKTGNRKSEAVAARSELIAALRDDGWSTLEIGATLGMDHTTVLYHIKRGPRPPVRRCDQDGCRRIAHARDMCLMHYKRKWRAAKRADAA